MKPLPRLDDDAAMLLRGKRSALGSARNEAAEAARDCITRLQGCDWSDIRMWADEAQAALERLKTLAAMWGDLS